MYYLKKRGDSKYPEAGNKTTKEALHGQQNTESREYKTNLQSQ